MRWKKNGSYFRVFERQEEDVDELHHVREESDGVVYRKR